MINNEPLRRRIANFEKGIQEDNDIALNDERKNIEIAVRENYLRSVEAALDQFSKVRYFEENDPEIMLCLPGMRKQERQKYNLSAKLLIKAIVYCWKYPRTTGSDLKALRSTALKGWAPNLNLDFVPILALHGKTFVKLNAIQKSLHADAEYDEPEDAILPERPLPAAETQP